MAKSKSSETAETVNVTAESAPATPPAPPSGPPQDQAVAAQAVAREAIFERLGRLRDVMAIFERLADEIHVHMIRDALSAIAAFRAAVRKTDFNDPEQLQAAVDQALHLLETLAGVTVTPIDDQVVAAIVKLRENLGFLIPWIAKLLPDSNDPVSASAAASAMSIEASALGFDPTTVLMIAELIAQLLASIRRRRQAA